MNIKLSKKVSDALKEGKAVVALESTIISHGMPYPKNVECALKVEEAIESEGAVAATIGIIDGVAIVGMTKEEIEEFGIRKGIVKCSRRDLPIVFAKKMWGATTVAATMYVAKKAGIEFFVTGGIGGAHKKANETFDISADLEELGNTDVSVICAGPKAILDLGLTMEILETKGVPVLGYNTDCLPAFFTNTSPYKIDYNFKDPLEAAEIIKAKRENNLKGGVLITNPVDDEHSIEESKINKIIDEAIHEMEEKGIKGKEETPFLLSKIVELTGGESLETNIALILSNAHLGAKIAIEYAKICK